MAKYLIRANYTRSGLTGLLKEGGTGRRRALGETIEGMGGTLEAFYYAFGDCDLYLIAELPDEATATAVVPEHWRRGGPRCLDCRSSSVRRRWTRPPGRPCRTGRPALERSGGPPRRQPPFGAYALAVSHWQGRDFLV